MLNKQTPDFILHNLAKQNALVIGHHKRKAKAHKCDVPFPLIAFYIGLV